MVKRVPRRDGRGPAHRSTRCCRTSRASTRSTGRRSCNRKWTDAADTARAAGRAEAPRPSASPRCRTNFKLHPLVEKVHRRPRARWAAAKQPLDWGMGEHLAYASLVAIGLRRAPVRPGRRPRHVLAPPRGAARPEPRALGRGHLHPAAERRGRPGAVRVIDSVLSEEAVLGFEYGYSTAEPNTLVDLGSAVRRLRQRRAGRDRPVHQRRAK